MVESYLNNEVLNGTFVHVILSGSQLFHHLLLGLFLYLINASISLLHLLETGLIDLGRSLNIEIHGKVIHSLEIVIIHLLKTFLNDLILLLLEKTLSHDLNLIGFFVSLLSHHSLKLESVCLKTGHHICYIFKSY